MPDNRENNRNRAIALVTTIAIHVGLLVLLLFLFLKSEVPEEGGGILVNIGDTPLASGMFMPHQLEPDYQAESPEPTPQVEDNGLLTQETPEAPEVKAPEKPKKDNAEEQRRLKQKRLEEQRKREEQEAARRRDAIRRSVSGAFSNTGSSGTGGDPMAPAGKAGSPDGNVASGGTNAGVGGFGSFSLAGRGLAAGTALQKPSYSVQEEGVIVVSITVNPSGAVIQALIGPGTTIGSKKLRDSALRAAKATRFNAVDELNNQTGTITYRFQLK